MKRFVFALLLVTGAGICTGLARAENWPHWRGPKNTGVSTETKLPAKFSATENVIWKTKLPGSSGGTPVVWGDRIFLMSEDGDAVVLVALNTDGKELWRKKLAQATGRKYMRDEGNDASPSPNTDGKHVYTFTGTGDLACFDFDGKQIWHFNVQERYGKFRIMHGMHVTPVIHGDRLYHNLLTSGGHHVFALDKATGKEIWKIDRKSDARSECEQAYASPLIWEKGKDAYLVVHGNDYATAHSLTDGSEIWRVGDLNPKATYVNSLRFVASPVVTPDLIVIPTAKSKGVVGLKPDAKGMILPGNASELWRLPRDTPDVPSPLVHDGLVYLCRENGILICLDAMTGKQHYSERQQPDRYRASPVYADGKIFSIARGGVVTVVKAGPKFEKLAENRFGETITSSLVVSNGRIYVRGWDHLYAIGDK